ncbi:MAG: hypothetical protein PUB52_01985 [Lachnospiraceae bacterium]|nr:hypothetical protein [Lachnospiraceae bacterium]
MLPTTIICTKDEQRVLETEHQRIDTLKRNGYIYTGYHDTGYTNPLTYDKTAMLHYEKAVYHAVYPSAGPNGEELRIPVSEPELHLYLAAGVPIVAQ